MQDKTLQLVSFEQAQKLKKLGFDWECCKFYYLEDTATEILPTITGIWNLFKNSDFENPTSVSAPTVSLALKWFRDERGWFGNINVLEDMDNKIRWFYDIKKVADFVGTDKNLRSFFNTYDEAETALLDVLIEIAEKEVEE